MREMAETLRFVYLLLQYQTYESLEKYIIRCHVLPSLRQMLFLTLFSHFGIVVEIGRQFKLNS